MSKVKNPNLAQMVITEQVLTAVKEAATDGKLACAKAHYLADQLQVSNQMIGEAADRMGIRIEFCQLGCF